MLILATCTDARSPLEPVREAPNPVEVAAAQVASSGLGLNAGVEDFSGATIERPGGW